MENLLTKIDNKEYHIKVVRKKVKRLNMRIDTLNNIVISCPKKYSSKEILGFIQKNSEWIIKAIDKNKEAVKMVSRWHDDNLILLFGKEFKIRKTDNIDDHLKYDQENIYYYHEEKPSCKEIIHFLSNMIIKRAGYLCELLNIKPLILTKNYQARWGCCHPKKNTIILNEKLICLDWELIDYVIYHEIAHLKVANHSKNYYLE